MSRPRRLRLSGGALRGLKIEVPPGVRPSSGRLREALFDIWGARLAGCRFLELFAGSGAVGIEAASRGAARVTLVEGDRDALAVLRRNLRLAAQCRIEALGAVLPGELRRRLPPRARYDLIFADPPYGYSAHEALLAAAEPRLAAGGEIGLEHRWTGAEPVPIAGLEVIRCRRYGDSGLTIFRRPAG